MYVSRKTILVKKSVWAPVDTSRFGAENREKFVKPNPIVMRYLKHNPVENNSCAATQRRASLSCI